MKFLSTVLGAVLACAAFVPAQVTTLTGTACSGPIGPLQVSGSPSLGDTLFLSPTATPANALIVVGLERVDAPLSLAFGCGCTLVPDLDLLQIGTFQLGIPSTPGLVGFQLYSQCYYATSGAVFPCSFQNSAITFSLSDAVQITVQP